MVQMTQLCKLWGCVIARIMKFPLHGQFFHLSCDPFPLTNMTSPYKHAQCFSMLKTSGNLIAKNIITLLSLPLTTPFIMWCCSSSHQELEPFPQPFRLGWSDEWFRPMECRIEDVSVLSLDLKRIFQLLLFLLESQLCHMNKPKLDCWRVKNLGKFEAPQPTPSLPLVMWESPAQMSRATYPIHTYHWWRVSLLRPAEPPSWPMDSKYLLF